MRKTGQHHPHNGDSPLDPASAIDNWQLTAQTSIARYVARPCTVCDSRLPVRAYATAGVAADELYAAVTEAAVRGGLAGFKPQNLANTVWAYATAGVAADAL